MLQLNFEEFPALYGGRLRLRKLALEDAPALFDLKSNDDYRTYVDRPKPASLNEIEVFIQSILKQFDNNEAICWVLSPKDGDQFMGTISFWRIMKEHYRAEIGYGIHPDFQRMGYMDEAMKLAIQYGFTQMKLHSIEANVNPENKASIALLQKNNFVQEAYFRENYYYDGNFLDSAIFCLLNKPAQ